MLNLSLDVMIVYMLVIAIFGTLALMSECRYIGRSLIAFIIFTVLLAIIYLYLGASIVAAFQVLIYSGAVVAFMLLALSIMREEVIERPRVDVQIVVRLMVAFVVLALVLLVAYYYIPLDLLTKPQDALNAYLDLRRDYVVSVFMWEFRLVDAVTLGIFTVLLATGVRHFYKEIMKRD